MSTINIREEAARCLLCQNPPCRMEVEAIIDCDPVTEKSQEWFNDENAAIEAERTGFCSIIPVEELPENFEWDGCSLRWFGWIDTAENRQAIEDFCKNNAKARRAC